MTMLKPGSNAPHYRELAKEGPVLVAFFKVSCPVCQLTMPFLERLKSNAKVRVVAVSQDDAKATAEFNKAFGVTLETVLDEKSKGYPASNGFGITQVPTCFQVEPDGSISHAWEGFSKADMEALARRAGVAELFRPEERVPLMRPG